LEQQLRGARLPLDPLDRPGRRIEGPHSEPVGTDEGRGEGHVLADAHVIHDRLRAYRVRADSPPTVLRITVQLRAAGDLHRPVERQTEPLSQPEPRGAERPEGPGPAHGPDQTRERGTHLVPASTISAVRAAMPSASPARSGYTGRRTRVLLHSSVTGRRSERSATRRPNGEECSGTKWDAAPMPPAVNAASTRSRTAGVRTRKKKM